MSSSGVDNKHQKSESWDSLPPLGLVRLFLLPCRVRVLLVAAFVSARPRNSEMIARAALTASW